MVNILLHTQDEEFGQDIKAQLMRYIDDITFTEDSLDVAVIDEDELIYQKLRKEHPLIPMVLLSSAQNSDSKDYLNVVLKKPFMLIKLVDILRAANNNLENSTKGYLLFNDYELHPNNKEILDIISGNSVRLTEKEIDILKYLYKTRNNYVSKGDLQKNVWQYSDDVTTHTIETHIYRVRQKVETVGKRRLILTLDGKYKLNMGG